MRGRLLPACEDIMLTVHAGERTRMFAQEHARMCSQKRCSVICSLVQVRTVRARARVIANGAPGSCCVHACVFTVREAQGARAGVFAEAHGARVLVLGRTGSARACSQKECAVRAVRAEGVRTASA